MKIMVKYRDHPEFNGVIEVDSWSEAIRHIGCAATSLEVICEDIVLKKSEAIGLGAFQYWHTCPKCGYPWITEDCEFCGKCGVNITFVSDAKVV